MALAGCSNQTYDMSDLATIAGSQRGVWEELGSVVPWWSVLSQARNLTAPINCQMRNYKPSTTRARRPSPRPWPGHQK